MWCARSNQTSSFLWINNQDIVKMAVDVALEDMMGKLGNYNLCKCAYSIDFLVGLGMHLILSSEALR